MTELELLRQLDERFRKVINEKRQIRAELVLNPNANGAECMVASAKCNAVGDMLMAFSDFYEQLGYSDEQIWNHD